MFKLERPTKEMVVRKNVNLLFKTPRKLELHPDRKQMVADLCKDSEVESKTIKDSFLKPVFSFAKLDKYWP